MPTRRLQFALGRLVLAVEFPDAAFLHDFELMYGIATPPAPAGAVPDVVFQLRRLGKAAYCWNVDGVPFDFTFAPALMRASFEWALHDALSVALLPAVTVHAAVVTNSVGHAVALVGVSGSGKSTLAAGLLASGWTLYCDEFFVIEPGGGFAPMPGMVSLKGPAIELIRRRSNDLVISPVAEDPLRGPIAHIATTRVATLESPIHLQAIFFPKFETNASHIVTRQSSSEAFFRIAEQSHNFHLLGARAFHDLAALARAPSYAMDFGDLDVGLDSIREVVQT